MAIRVRAALVDARTSLVNAARGFAQASGERLPGSQERLRPLLEQIESLTVQIKEADQKLEQIARIEYPETKLLRQISGVGVLIALTFVLTLEDSARFEKSRDVGCYVGLRPKRSESGQSQPELRITKEGDLYLRKMVVRLPLVADQDLRTGREKKMLTEPAFSTWKPRP